MLEPGSLLVLYSDGLVERRRERLGLGLAPPRAGRAWRSAVSPIDEVCDRLVAALGVEASRDDDVAVLAVRLLPEAAYELPSCLPGPRPEELRGLRAAMRAWMDDRGRRRAGARMRCCWPSAKRARTPSSTPTGTAPRATSTSTSREDADRSLAVSVRDFGRFRDRSSLERGPRPRHGHHASAHDRLQRATRRRPGRRYDSASRWTSRRPHDRRARTPAARGAGRRRRRPPSAARSTSRTPRSSTGGSTGS